ncbi:MAG: hypothetical protein IT353_07610 [Gemmatimonadaceae bacterium]|nr:hypothetical protein [Gemmatimonadaceae bacterium]
MSYTGELFLNPREGLLDGKICVNNATGERRPRFLLNAALNIKHVRDATGRTLEYDGDYDGRMVGEAREYIVLSADSTDKHTTFCVEYRGAVPVFESHTATDDWKGRIVATAGTLRAAEQTRWYPTLFDSVTARVQEVGSFDLIVRCPTCRAIYVNGAKPVRDTVGHFVSDIPRALLLFAGDIPVLEASAVTLVGASASPATVDVLGRGIADIATYFARLLNRPYRERPVLLSFFSVAQRYPPGSVNWQFVTWPTIAIAGGAPFDQLIEGITHSAVLVPWLRAALAHEMAHYYFGTLRMPTGPLFWFGLESTAEYLALKQVRAAEGESAYAERALNYLGAIGYAAYPSLSTITQPEQIGLTHRYRVLPLALMELEQRVGEAAMMRMLRTLVDAPPHEVFDLAAVRRAANDAGIHDDLLEAVIDPSALRSRVLATGHAVLVSEVKAQRDAQAVTVATLLVNHDTSSAGRLQVLQALREVSRRSPTLPRALYQIGKIGALTGEALNDADRALRRYLSLPIEPGQPSYADAHWRRGMIAERRNRLADAREEYGKALQLSPQHAGARAALTQLETRPRR